MQLTITTPKEIVLVADGQERVVSTTAATAGDLLAEQGIALSETDRTSLYLTQGLLNRMRLQVYRVQVSEVSETVAIEAERVETPDPDAFKGDEKVTTPGIDGEQVTIYRVTVVDGVETAREALSTTVTREPVAEQVAVGHQGAPANSPERRRSQLGGAGAVRVRRRPNAVSNTGTLPRPVPVLAGTWAGVGGTGDPAAASADEQTNRAQLLYERCGAGQWPPAVPLSSADPPAEHSARQSDGLLGPAAIRDLAQQLELRPTKTPRAELPARRQHDPADRAHRGAAPGRRRPRGRPRARLADPRTAAGRRAGGRRRDRPAAGRPLPVTVAARAPHLAAGSRSWTPTRSGSPRCPAPRRPRWSRTCPTTSPSRCCCPARAASRPSTVR